MALGRSTEQSEERPRADRDHVGRANVADVVSEVLLLEPALEPRVGEAKRREMESRGAATHDGAASLRLRTIPLRRREREVEHACRLVWSEQLEERRERSHDAEHHE